MRVLALANHKGGSGKTTVAVNLAHALSLGGQRVLLVDLDPQGNAGVGLGLKVHEVAHTTFGLLTRPRERLAAYVTTARANLDVVASNLDAASLETELGHRLNRERILATILARDAPALGYDVVVIDTPPSLGLLTLNALVAAQEVLVVVDCGFYALYGLRRLQDTVDLVREGFEKDRLELRAMVNNYDGRQNLDKDVVAEVRRIFGRAMLSTVVRRNVRIKEAQSAGSPLLEYAPSSPGAEDFRRLAAEILDVPPRGARRSARTKEKAGRHG
jgi:chromosome partitioning protein